MYGSLEESESAKEKVRKTMDGVNFKRHKVSAPRPLLLLARIDLARRETDTLIRISQDAVAAAKKAQYDEPAAEYYGASTGGGMDVNVSAPVAEDGGRKRKAEEEEGGEAKKARAGEYANPSQNLRSSFELTTRLFRFLGAEVEPVVEAVPLARSVFERTVPLESFSLTRVYLGSFFHRDRENSTVFVSQLPVGTTQEDLAVLFKDVRSFHVLLLSFATRVILTSFLSISFSVERSERSNSPIESVRSLPASSS